MQSNNHFTHEANDTEVRIASIGGAGGQMLCPSLTALTELSRICSKGGTPGASRRGRASSAQLKVIGLKESSYKKGGDKSVNTGVLMTVLTTICIRKLVTSTI